ncbi:unnamed protein product [Urochloa humidicola]
MMLQLRRQAAQQYPLQASYLPKISISLFSQACPEYQSYKKKDDNIKQIDLVGKNRSCRCLLNYFHVRRSSLCCLFNKQRSNKARTR